MKDKEKLLNKFFTEEGVNFICKRPFELVEVDSDGNVYLCFPRCNSESYIAGNLHEQTYEEIMKSDKAIEFKKDILNSEYKFCDFNNCSAPSKELHITEPNYNSLTDITYPKELRLHLDTVCNIKCFMCRKDYILNHPLTEEITEIFLPRIIEMCREAKVIFMNGSGEVLYSNLAKELILKITEKYPDIKFDFCTNGILCTKEKFKEYNIENRIKNISISLHCIKEDTYKKIIIGGNYKKVMENLKYLKQLSDNNTIDSICLNFVISKYNYKEMIEFAKYAQDNNFTANFSAILNNNDNDYFNVAVHRKEHPEYKFLRKILQNPIFNSRFCIFDNTINDVREDNTPLSFSLKDKIMMFFNKI